MPPTPAFLRSLIELATCETVDELLDQACKLLERELGVRGCIEVWGSGGERFAGPLFVADATHYTRIGVRDTIAAIRLPVAPSESLDVKLFALQIASMADCLLGREARRRRTRD